jgi:hypothetical protein
MAAKSAGTGPDDTISVTMTRREALALEKLAELGLRASEAFALVPNTTSAERGLMSLKAAIRRDALGTERKKAPRREPRRLSEPVAGPTRRGREPRGQIGTLAADQANRPMTQRSAAIASRVTISANAERSDGCRIGVELAAGAVQRGA